MIAPDSPPSFLISRQKPDLVENPVLFNEWILPNGSLWTGFYRMARGFLLRFPDLADFTVSLDGQEIVAYPAKGLAKSTVEHLYLNQVLPLARSRQHKLVLHASAVEIEDFAVAFLGESGRGKSTLAASFSTRGYRFLTDDGLELRKEQSDYLIDPSHPSIRLWSDSKEALLPKTVRAAPAVDYTPKLRLLADDDVAFCDSTRRLRCMYLLGSGDSDSVAIERANGRDAIMGLVRNSFLLDIDEREMLAHQFTQFTEMARTSMIFQLDYPRQFDMLPLVRDTVIQHAKLLAQS